MAELPPAATTIPEGFPREPFRRASRPQPVRASALVGTTFAIWMSSLPKLLAIAALVHVPRFALRCFFLNRGAGPVLAGLQSAFASLDYLVVPAFVSAFGLQFVFQRLREEPTDLGRSIALGFRRLGTALGITAILGAPLFAMVYFSTHFVLAAALHRQTASLGLLLLVFLATLVVNLVISLVFHVALPAAVVERIGVFAALGRSARLTAGRRATIFGASLLLVLATGVPVYLLLRFVSLIHEPFQFLCAQSAVQWFFGSMSCVFPIVLYHELRRTKEGFGIDELAKAFD